MLPSVVREVRYYVSASGSSPFEDWFNGLSTDAVAKIAAAVARIEAGNLSNAKAVGEGVLEFKIDWGPGYRIYFGQDGARLVILLAGGTKQRQSRDIARARRLWADYQRLRAPGRM